MTTCNFVSTSCHRSPAPNSSQPDRLPSSASATVCAAGDYTCLTAASLSTLKKLTYTVRVERRIRFGNMFLNNLPARTANSRPRCSIPFSLMDIGTEELGHLEIVGALARLHVKPMKFDRDAAETASGPRGRIESRQRLGSATPPCKL